MGVSTMRCSDKLLVPMLIVAARVPGLRQRTYNLGSAPPSEEVKALDHVVGPAGKELPPGSGTAKEGAPLFAQRCAGCHGPNGTGGGMASRLVASTPANAQKGSFKPPEKAATSCYPYATIAWDYINRAMPATRP